MKGQFTVPGAGVSLVVQQAAHMLVDIAADNKLKEVAHQYVITPVFVGIFGSRAKVYDGPESDFDLYVPYIGKLSQYVRAIEADTRQIEGEDILPPQITIEVVHERKTVSVQLNFVSLDHYIQELNRSNIDFRMALDNMLVRYCSMPVYCVLKVAAQTAIDLEKIKQMCIGRASKTVALMKSGKAIKHSEITDGLYRLLYAAITTNVKAFQHIYTNRTPSMAQLLDAYLTNFGGDENTRTTVEALLTTIRSGQWKDGDYCDVLSAAIIDTIERVIPLIKERPIMIPENFKYDIEQGIAARMKMISTINTMFIDLLMKAHTSRSLI